MRCPSCNQSATSFLRNIFSLQGVSIYESMQGYFRCQHCGSLLRVVSFGRHFWFYTVIAYIVLGVFAVLYRRLFLIIGTGATTVIWVTLVLLIAFTFLFGIWRYGIVQKIDIDKSSTDTPAA